MPSTTDFSDFCAGKLAARLATSATSGAVVTAQSINGSPVTWPTGAHRLKFVRKTRTGTEVETVGVASASQSGSTVTLGTLTRQLSLTDGSTFSSGGSGYTFPANTNVYLTWDVFDAEQTAKKDISNTFSATQTISSTNELRFADSATAIWDDGTSLSFKDSTTATKTLAQLAAAGGSDEKTGISINDTTPDYLLNKLTAGAGITLTETNDGGDETITIASTFASVNTLTGDGSDGDVTIGSPTTLTRDMFYDDLTVNSTLTTSGYRVFVKGTLSGTGTIVQNGNAGGAGGNASGVTAGTAGTAGSALSAGYFPAGVAGQAGGAGGNGSTGTGNGTNGSAGTAGTNVSNVVSGLSNGGAGGAGAAGSEGTTGGSKGTGGTAGAAGTATTTTAGIRNAVQLMEWIAYITGTATQLKASAGAGSGSGGGGAGVAAGGGNGGGGGGGGGSGSSGGYVLVVAGIISGSVSITATGGAGGAGGAGSNGTTTGGGGGGGGGGAGGSGGLACLIYGINSSWSGSVTAAGGAAGAAGANGTPNNNATQGTPAAGAAGSAGLAITLQV